MVATTRLTVRARDFSRVTASHVVIEPTDDVRDPATSRSLVESPLLVDLTDGHGEVTLPCTGQGVPEEWSYRITVYGPDAGRQGWGGRRASGVVTTGLLELPEGRDGYDLENAVFVELPDLRVDYPTLAELRSAVGGLRDVFPAVPDGVARRVYLTSYAPPDGRRPGDVVLDAGNVAAGPGEVVALWGWWDAHQTADAGDLTELPDISGQGHAASLDEASPASPAARVREAGSGETWWQFDGACYAAHCGVSGGPVALSGAIRLDSQTQQTIVSADGDGLRLTYAPAPDRLLVRRGSGGGIASVEESVPIPWSGGATVCFVWVLRGTSSLLWVNDVKSHTPAQRPVEPVGALLIGSRSRTVAPYVDKLGELAVYVGDVTDEEAESLSAQLMGKWST